MFRSGAKSIRGDVGDDGRGPDRARPSLDEETPPILDDDNIDDEMLRQSSSEESAEFVSSNYQDSDFCNIEENFSRVDDEDDDVQTCSICLLPFEDGDRVADLNCNHHFHAECISEWVRKKVSSFMTFFCSDIFFDTILPHYFSVALILIPFVMKLL